MNLVNQWGHILGTLFRNHSIDFLLPWAISRHVETAAYEASHLIPRSTPLLGLIFALTLGPVPSFPSFVLISLILFELIIALLGLGLCQRRTHIGGLEIHRTIHSGDGTRQILHLLPS